MKKFVFILILLSLVTIGIAQESFSPINTTSAEVINSFSHSQAEVSSTDVIDSADENIIDEIGLIQEERGKMQQARGIIVSSTTFSASEIQKLANKGAYGGFHFKVKMLDGSYKGKELPVDFVLFDEDILRPKYQVGDRVIVGYIIDNYGQPQDSTLYGKDRTIAIIALLVLFIASVIALGRKRGALSLAALMITIVLIFLVMVPSIIEGVSPILMAVLTAIGGSVITFIIISGFTHKTLSASLGSIIGFILAALLVIFFGRMFHITGIMNTDIVHIAYTTKISIGELMFAGILVGAIGAMMDVAISMASTVEELKVANPNYTNWQLFKSSLNVGKDLLGTMINTLILAYVGTALPFILLIYLQYNSNTSLISILNLEIIAEEILRSIIGSFGMVITIPATSFIAAYLKSKEQKKVKKSLS